MDTIRLCLQQHPSPIFVSHRLIELFFILNAVIGMTEIGALAGELDRHNFDWPG
ncbi:MAG: hypothetical protein LBR94_04245 [Desulfovibrio sp.]|nr:hypothetical protein [Desulfovibrio sp.]